jgi:hypothetical protein
MAHGSTTHDQLTELDEICFNFWQYTLLDFYSHCRTIPIDFKVCGKIICKRKDIMHPSLLRTFGFSEISTYDSYIPLIFGKFALTWDHFQNICEKPFLRPLRSPRSNNLKIQNDENSKWKLVKTRWNPKFGLSDLENDLLTSMTSEEAQWCFSKITFFKSVHQAEKNEL